MSRSHAVAALVLVLVFTAGCGDGEPSSAPAASTVGAPDTGVSTEPAEQPLPTIEEVPV